MDTTNLVMMIIVDKNGRIIFRDYIRIPLPGIGSTDYKTVHQLLLRTIDGSKLDGNILLYDYSALLNNHPVTSVYPVPPVGQEELKILSQYKK